MHTLYSLSDTSSGYSCFVSETWSIALSQFQKIQVCLYSIPCLDAITNKVVLVYDNQGFLRDYWHITL